MLDGLVPAPVRRLATQVDFSLRALRVLLFKVFPVLHFVIRFGCGYAALGPSTGKTPSYFPPSVSRFKENALASCSNNPRARNPVFSALKNFLREFSGRIRNRTKALRLLLHLRRSLAPKMLLPSR